MAKKQGNVFTQGQVATLAEKFKNCSDTIGKLTARIGCTEAELLGGKVIVIKDEDSQIAVSRPNKSGHVLVIKKFFASASA